MEKTAAIGKTISVYTIMIWAVSFAIPFLISGPQLITGTVVNALLFLSVSKLDKKALIPVIVLPSIAAYSHGILFGPATPFLLFFLPFIWAGNSLLVFVFSKNISNPVSRVFVSSGLKAIFLFLMANVYFGFHLVPKLFVTSMGLFQFYTAIAGGIVALFVLKLINERNTRVN